MQKIYDNISLLVFAGIAGMLMLSIAIVILHFRSQNILLKQKYKAFQLQIEHQQKLLEAIINSQESERKRIGQDLHDDVGTALSNLRLVIDSVENKNGLKPYVDEFSSIGKQMIDKIINDLRIISHNLTPPGIELYGFSGALEELCESIDQTGLFQINIYNHAQHQLDQLSTTISISLYRIMEELLNNTIKHAEAKCITIWLKEDLKMINIIYQDNGRGIKNLANHKRGMGFQNIESRLKVIGALAKTPKVSDSGYHFEFEIPN